MCLGPLGIVRRSDWLSTHCAWSFCERPTGSLYDRDAGGGDNVPLTLALPVNPLEPPALAFASAALLKTSRAT